MRSHFVQAGARIVILRGPGAASAASVAMEDQTRQRLKRHRAVQAILRIDWLEISSEELRLRMVAAAPNPEDDTITKRKWEAKVIEWRRMVVTAKTPTPESVPLPVGLLRLG